MDLRTDNFIYYSVKVTGLGGTGTEKKIGKYKNVQSTKTNPRVYSHSFELNKEFEYYFYCNDSRIQDIYGNGGYLSATFSGLPSGVKCEYDKNLRALKFSGKISTNGNHVVKIIFKDETGSKYYNYLNLLVYDSENMAAYLCNEFYVALDSSKRASIDTEINAKGGSGEYIYEVSGYKNAYIYIAKIFIVIFIRQATTK